METSTPGNGRTIEKALFIRATPRLVFRALTEPYELEKWLVSKAEYDNLSNRCFSLFADPYLSFTVEELHMPLDVTVQTEIKRDSKAVAAYAFEPTNDPIWIGGISQANLLTQQPISVGTQVQRRAKFMGRIIEYFSLTRQR